MLDRVLTNCSSSYKELNIGQIREVHQRAIEQLTPARAGAAGGEDSSTELSSCVATPENSAWAMASALDAGLASSEQRMDAARREFAAAMSSGATGSAAGGSPARSPAAASKREQLVARRTAMAQRRLAVRTPVESRFGSMQREAPSDAAAAAAAAAASERDEAAAQETRESVDQLLLDLQQLRGLNMQEASAAASARPVSPKPGTPTSIPMPVRAANLAASPRRAERGGVARDAAPRPQPAFGSGTAAGRSPQAAPPASPVAREAADAAPVRDSVMEVDTDADKDGNGRSP